MKRLRLSHRLLLLMLVAMLPITAVLFYNLYSLNAAREREARQEIMRRGQLNALELQRIFSGMENMLVAISAAPVVQSLDTERCNKFLASAQARLPGVSTIGVIGLDGVIKCRNEKRGIGTSVADRPYFKEALRTGEFVVGEYTKSRITGAATLPLAIPMVDDKGSKIGVMAMSLDLAWLQKIIVDRQFDPGAALTIADREGTIIARYPEPERFVGTRIPAQYRHLVTAPEPGTIELTSQDGTRRMVAYFPEKSPPKGVYIGTGLAVEGIFYSIKRATLISVFATVAAILITLFLAWQTSHYAIQRPVSHILGVLDAWRADDRSVRSGATSGDEFGTIGASIDKFMNALEEEREQRKFLEGEMGHRIKNLMALVQAVALQTFRGNRDSTEAMSVFNKRLKSMADAFDVLERGEHKAADLMSLVSAAIEPFGQPEGSQFQISGPQVMLNAKTALAFSMALHELGTNALKYGALKEQHGRVLINWRIEGNSPELRFSWEEIEGPAVIAPERSGFGSQIIEKALALETDGKIEIIYASNGLKYSFSAQLERVQ